MHLKKYFSADLRSLAAFRIAVASIVIFDTILRMTMLRTFYSDDGVAPREVYLSFARPWQLSLHYISGQTAVQAVLFLALLVAAFCMMIGYRTRLSTVITWALMYSHQARNWLVLYGGDALMLVLLFWAMFAPLGSRFSVDSLNSPSNKNESDTSVGTVALILQMAFVYIFTGLLKNDPIWWSEGSAVYYALSLDTFATPVGRYLLHFPVLLKYLTWGTLALELAGPVLAIFSQGRLRLIIALMFIGFHASHFICLDLGVFPFISIAGWLLFLPAEVWNWKVGRWFERQTIKISSAMNKLLPRVQVPTFSNSKLTNAFVICCLGLVLLTNAARVGKLNLKLEKSLRDVGYFLGLRQNWNMFAPYPLMSDGWFVFDGVLADGTRIDFFRNRDVTYDKPTDVSGSYKNYVWYTYLFGLWNDPDDDLTMAFGKYICRTWNKSHPDNRLLKTFEIHYMIERTPRPGEPLRMPEKNFVWEHDCFAKAKSN